MDKLRAYLNSLSTDDQYFFARRCGTTIGYLRKALSVGATRRLGTDICIALERESKGAVRCEDLRPDVNWEYVRSQSTRTRRRQATA